MNDKQSKTVLTTAELAGRIGAELVGTGSVKITSVAAIQTSQKTDVTFLTNDKYLDELKQSDAGAVIVAGKIEALSKPQLIVKDVDTALINALSVFAPKLRPQSPGIHRTAVVAESARIAETASIGSNVCIAERVEIGENTVIAAGAFVGENSKLGGNCRLDSNVVVYHNCTIGNNVIVQANSTIGSTGFGYVTVNGVQKLIPHNGGVIIEDFVEIGANCCIDRAKFGNTVVGAGTKIDNLVQIAHNVVIGKCCFLAGQVGIAGSSKLGNGVVLAGQAGVVDHVTIGDKTIVGAQAGVTGDIADGKRIFGSPAHDVKEALREFTLTRRLPKMAEQLKNLKKRIEELEAAKDDKD